jgi:hypothetical protein
MHRDAKLKDRHAEHHTTIVMSPRLGSLARGCIFLEFCTYRYRMSIELNPTQLRLERQASQDKRVDKCEFKLPAATDTWIDLEGYRRSKFGTGQRREVLDISQVRPTCD